VTIPSNPRVIICRSNPIDPDPRVEKTAQALGENGYPVTILGWDRTAILPDLVEYPWGLIRRLKISAVYGSGLQNFPALLRWQHRLLVWLIRHRKEFDIIHTCDFDTILPALILKFLWGKKVVYDIFDFYADHLRATPPWIKHLIRWLDNWSIKIVDGLIVADESRWDQIPSAKPHLSAVIYNTPKDIHSDFGSDDSFSQIGELSIVYVGLLQRERGIFELVNVLTRHPEWHLHLAGFGGDEQEIVSLATKLPNVHWYGRIPYQQALQLSRCADIIFATYDPAIPNHRYASPNKIFEAMMLGKPLIVARDTNIDQIVTKFECGLIVPYGDESALEDGLIKLSADPNLRIRFGKNARQAYEHSYQWDKMEARLIALYRSILTA
jgi:glycosyltransferase involved in cell wall biosynthesis